MKKTFHKKNSPYHFKQWPIWLLIGLLWVCVKLFPYRWHLKIGKYLGLLAYYFSSHEKAIVRINLSLCFPRCTPQQKEKLVQENFMAMGIGVMETVFSWWCTRKQLKKLAVISGIEHVQHALAQGKGVMVIMPHLFCMHIVGQLANLFGSFSAMFLPPKNPVFRKLCVLSMKEVYKQPIERHDARGLLNALKNNHPVFYTPDVDGGKKGIFAPFFGVPASTHTALARFVRLSGCAIVPFVFSRKKDGSGYEMNFCPPLKNYPSGDHGKDAQAINQLLEKFIRAHPEQYIWQYKRFKTRPPGQSSFYPARRHPKKLS